MPQLSEFLLIPVMALLGAMSPGPDFFVVTKNSLAASRKAGLYTALGMSVGLWLHFTYCLLGIGLVISESVVLYNCLKYAGAAYLIFIGVTAIRSTSTELHFQETEETLSARKAFSMGLLTNVLNPKATLFFLSFFSQVIDPTTPFATQCIYAFEIWLVTTAWFCSLAYFLSHQKLKSKLAKAQPYFEKVMGSLLVAFGMKIALL